MLRDSFGTGPAAALTIGVGLLALAVVGLVPLAMLRVSAAATRRRQSAARTVTVLGAAWLLLAVLGTPLASAGMAGFARDEAGGIRAALQDRQHFAAHLAAPDPFAALPGTSLLRGLRGKDVLIVFVESYGRVAVHGSPIAGPDGAMLRAGTRTLRAAGFAARSAYLTSPTFGGISWLAHSSLHSGLWVDSQQRYDQLVASDRFTLSDAFGRAGWHTVADVPANTEDWPQGRSFYHYDAVYDGRNVGYAGPRFSYAPMPDQYVLSEFARRELAPGHRPVMAELDLVSSHTPWAPLPRLVRWADVGDGSVYAGMPARGRNPAEVWQHAADVQAAYARSIRYTLRTLVSFVRGAADDNLVLVVLGDHQPATIVSGADASHDVPVSIVAHDPGVIARTDSWGWQDGLLPDPAAPVWPMDRFRDRFLTAYR